MLLDTVNNYSRKKNSSGESINSSVSQEIRRTFWNRKVHFHDHKRPPLVSVLRKINPLPIFPTDSFMIHSYIILHLRLGFPSISYRFPHKNLLCTSLLLKNATFAVHLILLVLIIRKIFDFETVIVKQTKKLQ